MNVVGRHAKVISVPFHTLQAYTSPLPWNIPFRFELCWSWLEGRTHIPADRPFVEHYRMLYWAPVVMDR